MLYKPLTLLCKLKEFEHWSGIGPFSGKKFRTDRSHCQYPFTDPHERIFYTCLSPIKSVSKPAYTLSRKMTFVFKVPTRFTNIKTHLDSWRYIENPAKIGFARTYSEIYYSKMNKKSGKSLHTSLFFPFAFFAFSHHEAIEKFVWRIRNAAHNNANQKRRSDL